MRGLSFTAFAVALAASLTVSVAEEGKAAKGTYRCIEVTKFSVAEGVQFPPEYQISLVEDLVRQLENAKRFTQVLRPGEVAADQDIPTLRLTGIITEYKAGSRAKRYLIGFGFGATKVVVQVQFLDRTMGNVLLDRKVDGKVVVGVMGGESLGATNGLAKEVAKVAKDRFF
mgnify:CR=1 FL=1